MKVRNVVVIIVFIVILLIGTLFILKLTDNKKSKNFKELISKEVENEDYTISSQESDSDILLIAIHGGGIEPGTTEIVKQIATESDYSYYSFNGIKKAGNRNMHLTSTEFDDPLAIELVEASSITLSFHGYDELNKKHTYIGGLDKELIEKITLKLKDAGFSVSSAPARLNGEEKDNIVNKNKQGRGVQLEISTAQREVFFKNNDLASKNRKDKQATFYEYTSAIEEALLD